MFVLPISGVPVWFRMPEGCDELLLAESVGHTLHLRAEVVRRLTPPVDGNLDWNDLPYADVDAALLAFRQRMTGDRLIAEVRCPNCAMWCDTEVSVSAYLAANKPQQVAHLDSQPDGWFTSRSLRFRVPTVRAVLTAASSPADVASVLFRTSISADSPAFAARAASILEKIAPPLAGMVRGKCPHCEQEISSWFDPGDFVLTELQQKASGVFEQVHLLAQAYGWSEATILGLPSGRRAQYAARIQQERFS